MRDFQTIQRTSYDVVVIGGGINGAAVARDAALRGLKTILLEKNDFASGTTSWSTRLIHGGLRYLEYLEFNLVRESLREREALLSTASHLVKPIQMTIPIYKQGSRGYWVIQAGMLLYDLLSFDKTLLSHRMLPERKFQQLFRFVNRKGLAGAAQYYDGQAEYAERLCLENILSAQEAGATVLNHAAVTHLYRQGKQLIALGCEDRLTGETFTIKDCDRAVVINTSGPWVDAICQLGCEGDPDSKAVHSAPIGNKPKMGGTKGSHIIVEAFPGAPEGALYVEAEADGRPFFIVPWLGMYLIGTTDLRYQGSLDRIKASNEEIDYLIRETNHILPTANLSREDVRFTYSGVRPLPYSEGAKPGSITRSHILFDHEKEGVANLISLIGGKLTTYRQVGEEMVDAVYRKLKRPAPKSSTLKKPLPGKIWPDDPRIEQALDAYKDRIPSTTIKHLFALYGANAIAVLALVDGAPDLAEPIVERLPDICAQIVYAVQSELACTFVDICRRRTALAMKANYGFDALPALTDTLIKHCGWTREECDRQAQEYRTYIENNCLPDYAIAAPEPQPTLA